MPEGDSLLRAARRLHQALAGRVVTRFESVYPALTRVDHDRPLRGRTIERVYARGKHLLIEFSGGLALRSHLRMHGSWHLYRPGERWQRPGHGMRIIVGTDAFEAIGFDVPDAEFIKASDVEKVSIVAELGPDVLGPGFSIDEAVQRLAERGDMEIADALLDQRALAGIGNIWKSESLFAARISPFVKVAALTTEQLRAIVDKAQRLMRPERRPVFRVYGRQGRPCSRCGTPISRRRQGPNARSTYWCERCQVTSASQPAPDRG